MRGSKLVSVSLMTCYFIILISLLFMKLYKKVCISYRILVYIMYTFLHRNYFQNMGMHIIHQYIRISHKIKVKDFGA